MKNILLTSTLLLAATLGWQQPAAAQATPGAQAHWAPSWMASPQPLWGPDFVLPAGIPARLENASLRQAARLSIGGRRLRVALSNEFGTRPLQVGRARVGLAIAGPGLAVDAGAEQPLRFSGQPGATVPPGAVLLSDPVELAVADGARLAVSLYLPGPTDVAGFHFDARDQALLARGDATGRAVWPTEGTQVLDTRAFLAAILVESARPPATVVVLGDSLTDGNGATPSLDRRWPDALARRLAPRGVGVLNAGISGNRLLRDGMGLAGLARAGRDVFGQPGVRAVVVLLGTNDIGWPGGPFAPREPLVTPEELVQGYRELIAQARRHGVRIVGATIPPFEHALRGTPLEGHYSDAKERIRVAVNHWIRESREFDGVVDFDRLLRDEQHPKRLRADYDSGDHLHPGDAGYRAMAEAVDLGQLLGTKD